jgi:hypothetical protein
VEPFNDHLKTILLAIQGVADPTDRLDVVARAITDKGLTAAYQTSIEAALASDTKLSGIIAQDHAEAVVRNFLTALLGRLG